MSDRELDVLKREAVRLEGVLVEQAAECQRHRHEAWAERDRLAAENGRLEAENAALNRAYDEATEDAIGLAARNGELQQLVAGQVRRVEALSAENAVLRGPESDERDELITYPLLQRMQEYRAERDRLAAENAKLSAEKQQWAVLGTPESVALRAERDCLAEEVVRLEAEVARLTRQNTMFEREWAEALDIARNALNEVAGFAAVIEKVSDALDPDAWGPTRDKAMKARDILASVDTDAVLAERDAEVRATELEAVADVLDRMYAGTDGSSAEKWWIGGVEAASRKVRERAAAYRKETDRSRLTAEEETRLAGARQRAAAINKREDDAGLRGLAASMNAHPKETDR